MSIRVEDDRDPKAIVRLCEELYAGLPVPVPDLVQEGGVRPALVVVARRPDGGLLGWAQVRDRGDGASVAQVQWLLVSQGRERIAQGHNVVHVVTPEERAVVMHLVRGAADSTRRAGYSALEWTDPDGHLDARAAAELGATEVEELGRRWRLAPLAGWTTPSALPAVTVRPVPQSATDAQLSAYADFYTEATGHPFRPEHAAALLADRPPQPHLALDLLTPEGAVAAQTTAVIAGETAAVEGVLHRPGVGTGQLTALLAALVDQLRRDHPDATLLEVQECHGAPVAEALAATGARVAHRWLRHRLPLREEHQDTT
ncbi:hypothetical protein ACGFOU_19710 [Streptomyces sp. NPDC048595]|uniref:hypothetical protein n=1 Tax=Streptomyces sp. NPDC048595 TaxID=3365576 RepID=UPI003710C741